MKEILVTDDDKSTYFLVKNLLRDTPYRVVDSAGSCSETLEKIKIRQPDVILMNETLDANIHEEDSFSNITRQLNIPVIYLNDKENKIKSFHPAPAINETFNISKPIEKTELLHALNKTGDWIRNSEVMHQSTSEKLINNITSDWGESVLTFIKKYANIGSARSVVLSTTSRFNINVLPSDTYDTFVNLKRINDINYLNKFFETINNLLPVGGTFIGFGETKGYRKKRILKRFPLLLNYFVYSIDFIFTRIFPKVPFTKRIYFYITKGRNRILSRAEMLGRLYSCGFEIIEEQFINNRLFFSVRKIRRPYYDYNPTYGVLVKMRRVGKNGKIIGVYKFRTMHPYSEYLHDYILKNQGYSSTGKPANDFRITTWGKILRKFWLDELPQLYNVLKGEMNLVGPRPISQRVYNDYPEDIKKLRAKFKPGCVPPSVALLMSSMKDTITSERVFLLEKEKKPYTTDIKYFFKAVYNIITNKIRSA